MNGSNGPVPVAGRPTAGRPRALGRLRWPLAAALVIALLAYGVVFVIDRSSTPVECSGCHLMRPQALTWGYSSHSKVPCTGCHVNSSITAYRLRNRLGLFLTPVALRSRIPNDVCLRCHSRNRTVTPTTGLMIPHEFHSDMDVGCVKCHSTLVHGGVAEWLAGTGRAETAVSGLEAEKLATSWNRIPMENCMGCHNGQRAPGGCPSCHSDLKAPADHAGADWVAAGAHGFSAMLQVRPCYDCHEYDLARKAAGPPEGSGFDEFRGYVRSSPFCATCHRKRPPGHGEIYMVGHGRRAGAVGRGCMVCHDGAGGGPGAPAATAVVCSTCHYNVHPAGRGSLHGAEAERQGASACFKCHDTSSCSKCHRG